MPGEGQQALSSASDGLRTFYFFQRTVVGSQLALGFWSLSVRHDLISQLLSSTLAW